MTIVIRIQEKVSFYTHLAGAIAAFFGTLWLIYAVQSSATHVVVSMVYGLSVIMLFSASTAYHGLKQDDDEISLWRKLDHIAIFVMIAGTYTPVCYAYLSGHWKWSIIIFQWALVLAGFFLKFFYLNAPRYFSTVIYLFMGWIGVIAIKELVTTMPFNALFYLFAGGISYTVGAIFYAIEKPVFSPWFGFHEIFHFFVLLGAFFHFLLVYIAMTA